MIVGVSAAWRRAVIDGGHPREAVRVLSMSVGARQSPMTLRRISLAKVLRGICEHFNDAS